MAVIQKVAPVAVHGDFTVQVSNFSKNDIPY